MRRFQRYLEVGATESQKIKEKEWAVKFEKDTFERFIQKMKSVMTARISEDKKDIFNSQATFEVTDGLVKMTLAFGDGEYFSYVYHKCIQKDIKVLSTFEKIDSKEGKVEIFFKPDIRQNTWRYKNSEKIQDVDVPECQYPNEFLKQFSDFDPEVKNKKLKLYFV